MKNITDLVPTLVNAAVLLRHQADLEILDDGVVDLPSDEFPTADAQPIFDWD